MKETDQTKSNNWVVLHGGLSLLPWNRVFAAIHYFGVILKFYFTKIQKSKNSTICAPKRSTGPYVNFFFQKGRQPAVGRPWRSVVSGGWRRSAAVGGRRWSAVVGDRRRWALQRESWATRKGNIGIKIGLKIGTKHTVIF